jgi:hypothetical protein
MTYLSKLNKIVYTIKKLFNTNTNNGHEILNLRNLSGRTRPVGLLSL